MKRASSTGIEESTGIMDDQAFRLADDNNDNILLGE